MADDVPTASRSEFNLVDYRLDIKEHWTPPEGESSDHLSGFYYIPNFINEQEEEYLIEKIKSSPKPKWRTLQNRSGRILCRLQYWGGQLSGKQVLIPETMPDFLSTFPPLIKRIKATGAFLSSKHGEPNHCLVNEYEPGQGIMVSQRFSEAMRKVLPHHHLYHQPHEDGGAYFAAVATVSLGSHTLLDIYRYADTNASGKGDEKEARSREQDPRFSILQERRSLLITRGAAYKDFLHGIAERSEDDSSRLQLVVNKHQLVEAPLKEAVEASKSGPSTILPRELRLSLTFRDVEKVAPKGLTNMLGKR